jgi:hypothetical protein
MIVNESSLDTLFIGFKTAFDAAFAGAQTAYIKRSPWWFRRAPARSFTAGSANSRSFANGLATG